MIKKGLRKLIVGTGIAIYTLTATGTGGTATPAVTINVNAPAGTSQDVNLLPASASIEQGGAIMSPTESSILFRGTGTTVRNNVDLITTETGNGTAGYGVGDGRPAKDAQLNNPAAVAVDSGGNIYIADRLNNRIRKVSR